MKYFKLIPLKGNSRVGTGGQYLSYGFVFKEDGMEIFIPYSNIDRIVHWD